MEKKNQQKATGDLFIHGTAHFHLHSLSLSLTHTHAHTQVGARTGTGKRELELRKETPMKELKQLRSTSLSPTLFSFSRPNKKSPILRFGIDPRATKSRVNFTHATESDWDPGPFCLALREHEALYLGWILLACQTHKHTTVSNSWLLWNTKVGWKIHNFESEIACKAHYDSHKWGMMATPFLRHFPPRKIFFYFLSNVLVWCQTIQNDFSPWAFYCPHCLNKGRLGVLCSADAVVTFGNGWWKKCSLFAKQGKYRHIQHETALFWNYLVLPACGMMSLAFVCRKGQKSNMFLPLSAPISPKETTLFALGYV